MHKKKESDFLSYVAEPKNIFWLIRVIIFLCFFFSFLFEPQEHDLRVWVLFSVFLIYSFGFFIYVNRARSKAKPA